MLVVAAEKQIQLFSVAYLMCKLLKMKCLNYDFSRIIVIGICLVSSKRNVYLHIDIKFSQNSCERGIRRHCLHTPQKR